ETGLDGKLFDREGSKEKVMDVHLARLGALNPPWDREENFLGVLGNATRIRAKLEPMRDAISGVYRYTRSNEDLKLAGSFDEQSSHFDLVETNTQGVQTGRFRGFALARGFLAGMWSSPDDKRTYPFMLSSFWGASVDYPQTIDIGGAKLGAQERY